MTHATILSDRGVLKISGKDRTDFLQGLITNDVHKITETQGVYAALLSPQGKFQFDLFLVAFSNENPEFWLMDCDRDRADMLLKRLNLYKLRSEVMIENVSDQYEIMAVYGNSALKTLDISPKAGAVKHLEESALCVDPRFVELGVRLYAPQEKSMEWLQQFHIEQMPFDEYDLHRLKLGVPDGNRDVIGDRGILLECGFDELNAIDWNKGCYMGQELTARTRYRGLVRKRLIPVRIEGDTPPYQSPILQDGVEVGELRSSQKSWGIAMIRLEAMRKSLPFSCGDAILTPHIPQWMILPSLTGEE